MKGIIVKGAEFDAIIEKIEKAMPNAEVVGRALNENKGQYQAIFYGTKHSHKNKLKKAIVNIYEGKKGITIFPVGSGDVLKTGENLVAFLTV